MSEHGSGHEPVYRVAVWEAEDGWHWRVEIDVPNGRAWNGITESRAAAFDEVIDRLGLVESIEQGRE